MYVSAEYTLEDIAGEELYLHFKNASESASAMDGWHPKEFRYLSRKVCKHIATLLNQIEKGAPWPKSARLARVVYLEKIGAVLGEVMSYRPLTITSPLYREWGSLRLRHMAPWINEWKTEEMYAGVPEYGATDAWHLALARLEHHKLNDTQFCGGVADIAKFFDQLRRNVIYRIATYAGMPQRVLNPYADFLEHLQLHNCIAGGVGTAYHRQCGIPQGCSLPMMIVAMIMRPWIMLMRNYTNVVCYILADDVLITAAGEQMYNSFVSALNETHDYLQQMGARIAPDKSFNFASHPKAREWLERTLWPMIGQGIEVVNDFRYLGSHLSARASLKSSTLTKRLRQAL